jgi:UDP-GlcNAc3NAcA epimerase
VKAAVVSRAFAKISGIEEVIVHTGQHYDGNMSDVFFTEMCIPKPKYNLGVCGLSHGAMTGRMMEQIEAVMLQERPDWVLVYGDTDSTLAGALAASKLHIRLAHVEAGLRSFNMQMPEEINRILTDRVSNILFCPTQTAIDNLRREGYDNIDTQIVRTGDVMYDAALFYSASARPPQAELPEHFILCTLHRAENTDAPEILAGLMTALEEVSGKHLPVVLPLHPRTRAKLDAMGYDRATSPIRFIEPVGYFEMVWLLQHCSLVMTDSGGVQKEAFFFRRPCVTLRNETEWVELVAGGYNRLAGTMPSEIMTATETMLAATPDYSVPLYGDGHSGELIIKKILES